MNERSLQVMKKDRSWCERMDAKTAKLFRPTGLGVIAPPLEKRWEVTQAKADDGWEEYLCSL